MLRTNYPYCSSFMKMRPWRCIFQTIAWVFVLYTLAGAKSVHADERIILAFGDSLTAGFGLNGRDSFPSRLEMALQSAGHKARVINGGVSGDTTAGGLARLDWLLQDRPNLVVVELGANDAMRGLDPAGTRRNLDQIIRRIKKTGASVILAGMFAPPNMGATYGAEFNAIFPDLARIHNVPLYKFFLDGVVQDPALNLPDGIHPNAAGIAIIVKRMLPLVEDALKEAKNDR